MDGAKIDVEATAALLADAFHDDPLESYVLPDPADRRERSPAQFAALLRHGILSKSVVDVTDGGAAIWQAPDPVNAREANAELQRLPEILGRDAFLRFGNALDYLSHVHGASAPKRAWYLSVVGVAPDRHRRGIGRALIEPMLARADAERLPVLLDTSQPRNRAFYEALGFHIAVETVDPTSGLRLWTFQRDPR